LRVAERRMLTEGEPGDAAPVPLSRTIFQRFVNRRSLVWLGLTAAIAVIIVINDRQQKAVLPDKGVALARIEREKTSKKLAGEPFRPATIQAAPEAILAGAPERKTPIAKKPGGGLAESENYATVPRPNAALKQGVAANGPGVVPSVRVQVERLDASGTPAKAAPPATTSPFLPQDRISKIAGTVGKTGAFGAKDGQGESNNWYDRDRAASIDRDVLVVFCDVSPEATTKKAFDKVLAANGIVPRRYSAAKKMAVEKAADRRDYVGDDKAAVEDALKKQLPADGVLRRRVVADNAVFFYVEATPAQVKATLDGLAAQPKAFVSVSVKSAQDDSTRQMVRHFATRGEEVQGKSVTRYDMFDGENRRENRHNASDLAVAKPAEAAATKRAAPAPVKAKKNDLAELGSPAKADSSPKPARDKSEKGTSMGGRGIDIAQSPKDSPSVALGGVPRPPASVSKSSSQRGSQTQSGAIAQQAAPSESAAGAGQGGQVERQVGGSPASSPMYAQSALRQRVLFILWVGDGPPAVASEVDAKSGDSAKQAPSPASAAPAPSK